MSGNLLLVDDDVGTLHFLRACVSDMADLRVARSGADALRLARMQRPDLMVLDLQLGDTDGLSFLETLRRDDALADLPVIFISAERDAWPRIRALDLDALDWLTKPLDRQRLRARLQAALRRAPLPGAGGAASPDDAGEDGLLGAAVLAVDDDPIVLEALRLALAPEGLRTCTAASAGEALALAATERPELVLIDMVMPGENGFDLARRLMAMPAMADVPLIFVTQHDDAASEVRALGLGAFDFIGKPVVPALLRARVRNALRLRRRAIDALQRAQSDWRQVKGPELAAIIANAHDPIVVLDEKGRLMLANEASHALLGGDRAPFAGTELPAWLRAALPGGLLDGTLARADHVGLQAPGQVPKDYAVAATVIGRPEQPLVALAFFDQSDRIRAEQLAARQQLELEAQGRARNLMLSYLAHEMGNPLNGIIGLTGLLLSPAAEAPLSTLQRRKLTMVADCADILQRLMRDTLDLARWQAGRFSVDLGPVLVRHAIEPTLGALVDTAQRAAVTIAEPTGDLDAPVQADAHRLRQCLHNLVSNACKYGRTGGRAQVDVIAGADEVEISVSDDGLGLSPEQITHLFEPFERLGRAGPTGHGLGLAVTRMLALAMGGRLEVSSQEGQGSRFTLVLPRAHGVGSAS